jgi:hypothetical protein
MFDSTFIDVNRDEFGIEPTSTALRSAGDQLAGQMREHRFSVVAAAD